MRMTTIAILTVLVVIALLYLANKHFSLSRPAWAINLDPAKKDLFLKKVGEYFHARGLGVKIDAADGTVKFSGLGQGQDEAMLDNIAAICAQLESSEWDAVIADHFDKGKAAQARMAEFETQKHDFEQVKDLIHVRLYEHGGYGTVEVVSRAALPGTDAVLVFDFPDSIKNVEPNDLKVWGKGPDELFRLGLENVKEHYPPSIQTVEMEGGVLKTIEGDNFYNTTYALLIGEYPELLGSHGALVGIPVAGIMISHPINDLGTIKVITTMVSAVHGFYNDGPRSTSDKIYWCHEGKCVEIPTTFEPKKRKVAVAPPDEFVQMLNGLKPTTPSK